MSTKAIIFDMDGVISDTQGLHAQIESSMLARFGIDLPADEITRRYAGCKTAEFFKELLDKKGVREYSIEAMMQEKRQRAMSLISEVEAIPGTVRIIEDANRRNILQAVASSSTKDYVHAVLKQLKLYDYFGAVVSGDQVKNGKPNPEIFLKAADEIGVSPKDCVVIEDGRSGMTGAKEAGMRCVGLVYDERAYPADLLVNDLRTVSLDEILTV